jgi:hypothetical protein
MMNEPNHNAIAMIDAIKTEWLAAQRENRNPCSTNVLKIFRAKARPKLSKRDTLALFDLVFSMYLEVTGHRIDWSKN